MAEAGIVMVPGGADEVIGFSRRVDSSGDPVAGSHFVQEIYYIN
jgi:hypothetical protein